MTVAAIDRCLSLIEALVERPDGLALGDLATSLGLPNSAVHRTLSTLAQRGYVRQDPVTQAYRLTLRLSVLGFHLLDARHLPDAAQAVLQQFAAATGEYCRLAVVDGEGLTWIARAQGSLQGLRYDPPIGREVVLHATATGKAWLATLPEDDALRIVFAHGFPTPRKPSDQVFGERVVRTIEQLRAQLAETRKRGYAVAIEEGEPGTVAMAATFRAGGSPRTPVAGTVSVAGPVIRFEAPRRKSMAPMLLKAAEELSALWPLRQRERQSAAVPTGASAKQRGPRALALSGANRDG